MKAERSPRANSMTGSGKRLQIAGAQSADNSRHDGAESQRPTMRKAPCATRAELRDILASATVDVPTAGFCLGISRSSAFRAAKNQSLPNIVVSGRRIVPASALARMLGVELEP